MQMTVRSELRGAHVHLRIFMGPEGLTQACCGELVMLVEEWRSFLAALRGSTSLALVEDGTALVESKLVAQVPAPIQVDDVLCVVANLRPEQEARTGPMTLVENGEARQYDPIPIQDNRPLYDRFFSLYRNRLSESGVNYFVVNAGTYFLAIGDRDLFLRLYRRRGEESP